jgi:hypothetical protein
MLVLQSYFRMMLGFCENSNCGLELNSQILGFNPCSRRSNFVSLFFSFFLIFHKKCNSISKPSINILFYVSHRDCCPKFATGLDIIVVIQGVSFENVMALRGKRINNFNKFWCLVASGGLEICVSSTSF